MITPELLDYLRQAQTQGIAETEIKNQLINTGWSEADINEGWQQLATQTKAALSGNNLLHRLFGRFSWKWTGLVAAVLLILIGLLIWSNSRPRQAAQTPAGGQQQNQTGQLPGVSGNTNQPAAPQSANMNEVINTYLAYKNDLYTKTQTKDDFSKLITTYWPKYKVDLITQNNSLAGVTNMRCYLATFRLPYPEPARLPLSNFSAKQLNNTTVILSVDATGGWKGGQITMVKESDGWKVEQESWPSETQSSVPLWQRQIEECK